MTNSLEGDSSSQDYKSRRICLKAPNNRNNMSKQERQVHKTKGQGSQMLLPSKNGSHQTSLEGLEILPKEETKGEQIS